MIDEKFSTFVYGLDKITGEQKMITKFNGLKANGTIDDSIKIDYM